MPPDSQIPDSTAEAYPPDSMHVEKGSTPDGRMLLYFTFPPPEQPQAGDARREKVASRV